MPNSVKRHRFPQEPGTAPEADDDFDFGSLDELATMMVDALTLPLLSDFRDADGSDTGAIDPRKPHPSKRIN